MPYLILSLSRDELANKENSLVKIFQPGFGSPLILFVMLGQGTPRSFQLWSDSNIHAPAPPSSPAFQMPNVFVIPPEEEQSQTPPWCYFSAANHVQQNLSSSPDFNSLDDALHHLQDPDPIPTFKRSSKGIIMPVKANERRSRDDEVGQQQDIRLPVGTGNDSEVVEVVRLKKTDVAINAGVIKEVPTMKRSKTFKARASKAFWSIKNVGRVANRKASAKDIWPSSANADTHSLRGRHSSPGERDDEPTVRARNHSLPRGSTIVLSQLFQSPDAVSTTEFSAPISAYEPVFSALPPKEPSPTYTIRLAHQGTDVTDCPEMDVGEDCAEIISVSPTRSTNKSFRNRFSTLDLHRFFSFSPSTVSSAESSPTLSMSRGVSSSSASEPETPSEDIPTAFPYGWQSPMEAKGGSALQDMSFEMRLESLHFDSLSFDPENF
jgi:hypothetical protein